MCEIVKLFKTTDGEIFDVENKAKRHQQKIEIENVLKFTKLTQEEVARKLQEAGEYFPMIKLSLITGVWTTWEPCQIAFIVDQNILELLEYIKNIETK